LIEAFRIKDCMIVVMPFIEHLDFKIYMHCMKAPDVQKYFKSLFNALGYLHQNGKWFFVFIKGILHRDIKPSNFLYDISSGTGILVDFGLAQRIEPSNNLTERPRVTRSKDKPGYYTIDPRFIFFHLMSGPLLRLPVRELEAFVVLKFCSKL